MTHAQAPMLHLDRPAFWTEANDPEAWFRALEVVAVAAQRTPQTGTPRTVAERCLLGTIAWRGATGLFGVFQRAGLVRLPGVGLIECDAAGHWGLSDEAQVLLRHWKKNPSHGLELLSTYLVRESPWLRLLLLRLTHRDWMLVDWAEVSSGRVGLKAGISLQLQVNAEPEHWFAGLEQLAAGRWLARAHGQTLGYAPEVFHRKKGKDDLSLTPLTAPLMLLEAVGWLTRTGVLNLPGELQGDLLGRSSPAQVLAELIRSHTDVLGFVPAEPVLRELLAAFGASPDQGTFVRWMDALVERAQQRGALELLAAEPGQARHGRGLFGDPGRKLVRWVVHGEFDDIFRNAWRVLETRQELIR